MTKLAAGQTVTVASVQGTGINPAVIDKSGVVKHVHANPCNIPGLSVATVVIDGVEHLVPQSACVVVE
jgi:hypothetical protein